MGKKGFVTIEILTIIFVPGMLTLFLVSKASKLLNKITPKKATAASIEIQEDTLY